MTARSPLAYSIGMTMTGGDLHLILPEESFMEEADEFLEEPRFVD